MAELTSFSLTNEGGTETLTLIVREGGVESVLYPKGAQTPERSFFPGVLLKEAVQEAYTKGWKVA